MIWRKTFILCITFACLWFPEYSHADERRVCGVFAKMLRGTGKSESHTRDRLRADGQLADIADQLAPLPYSRFQVIDERSITLGCGAIGTITFRKQKSEEQTLSVTVDNIIHDGAMLTISWRDRAGSEILSTQVRLMNERSWIFGSDTSPDSSTIMSLRVNCGEVHE